MDTTRKKGHYQKMPAKSFCLNDEPKKLPNLQQNPHKLKTKKAAKPPAKSSQIEADVDIG